jgi:hypothetical protein
MFVLLSQLDDSSFFMCNVEDAKFLADIIEHVPLALRARYIFSCAPINKKMPFVCTMFLKVNDSFFFPMTLSLLIDSFTMFFRISMLDNSAVVKPQHSIGYRNKLNGHSKCPTLLWISFILKKYSIV